MQIYASSISVVHPLKNRNSNSLFCVTIKHDRMLNIMKGFPFSSKRYITFLKSIILPNSFWIE